MGQAEHRPPSRHEGTWGDRTLTLETRLPNLEARTQIIQDHAASLPPDIKDVDIPALAEATEDLTGADLKALMEDGKMLYAYDRARGVATRPPTEYFVSAIATIRANKERYAAAEAKIRMQRHFEGLTPPRRIAVPDVGEDD